jgi:hypothetical protein
MGAQEQLVMRARARNSGFRLRRLLPEHQRQAYSSHQDGGGSDLS